MALMAAHGEITPMPDAAIFADTGAEPKGVYDWLGWLEKQLPFAVHRVSAGNLRHDLLTVEPGRSASIPSFTYAAGSKGMARRQCTLEYKIEPIMRKVRELIGLKPRQRGPKFPVVTQLIGISRDEVQRMKPSREAYISNRHPLIDLRMTRRHCLEWMSAHDYPMPVKSACTFCPYHDNALWRDMRDNDPESWADAVAVDRALRDGKERRVKRGMRGATYLHRDCAPLDQVDLRSADDAGQGRLFDNECEGMCGV
jgi:hypothetical protein